MTLKGQDILDLWLDKEPDGDIRVAVQLWLFHLIADPAQIESTPVPLSSGLTLYSTVVPGTSVDVTYALTTDAVVLRRIETVT